MLAITEKQFLIKALGQFVCDEVQLAVKPLHEKMKNIEGAFEAHRAACTEIISAKRDEVDKLLAVHTQAVDSALEDVIKNLPQPKDGTNGRDGVDAVVDYERIQKFIRMEIDALPKPQDGAPGKDGKDGRDGVDGKNGVDCDKDFMIAEIYGAIHKAFEDNPPKDGKDGKDGRDGVDGQNLSLDDVRDCLNDLVAKAVAGIPIPRHCTGGYINRDGHLFLAFSDGAHSDLGPVVGQDGKDCDMEIIRTQVTAYLATIEKPKDGKDGKDGVGFDDMVLDYDGERALTFQFIREGGLVKTWEFTLPIPLVRDVYKQGNYKRGDIVIRGGSMYVAGKDTATMPGIGDSDWKLCTKAGRDGKPGAAGPPGPPGRDGQNGRDLTQLGPDGRKW